MSFRTFSVELVLVISSVLRLNFLQKSALRWFLEAVTSNFGKCEPLFPFPASLFLVIDSLI